MLRALHHFFIRLVAIGISGLLAATFLLITASPALAAAPTAQAERVPILMYHYIRVNPNPRDLVGADLSVTPLHFAQQMQYLAQRGYHTITLDDLTASLENGKALPSKPVILTFDDGYEDFYTAAFPVLQHLGFKATSFVITGKVGRQGYLTWAQMKTMEASGLVQIESHTVDHIELNAVSLNQAQYELTSSKAAIQAQLGKPVLYFCYPSGRYNAQVETLVREDGYLAATTTHPGTVHTLSSLDALTRVRIHGSETLQAFAAQLP